MALKDFFEDASNDVKSFWEKVSTKIDDVVDDVKSGELKDKFTSWIGEGENASVSADEIKSAVSDEKLQEIADEAGVSVDEAAAKLSETLPTVVDKVTTDGEFDGKISDKF